MSEETRYEVASGSSIYSRQTTYGRRLAATGEEAIALLETILGTPHEYEKDKGYPVWKIQQAEDRLGK
jgi:hypothetical protein